MSALIIDKNKTCSFSGHRILPKDFDVYELEKSVYNAINEGFSTFLVGMAIGFDALCFRVLEKIREKNDIRIVACVPCGDQDKFYNVKQKKEYSEMLSSADEVICLSESYYNGCMRVRNEYMVDNSSRLICFFISGFGGTYSTVKYAVEKGVDVVYLGK